MDPTTEANKKRSLLIDLNELPHPGPQDRTSGETRRDSLHSPPTKAVGVNNSGQVNESERRCPLRVEENGGKVNSERKRRKLANDSQPRTAWGDGGVQVANIRGWQKWGKLVQMLAWESGDDGPVDWKELMNNEWPEVAAASTERNGPRLDEDKDNNAPVDVPGSAPPVAAAGSPEVVARRRGRIRTLPNKYKDSILLERLPSSRHD